MENVFSRVLIKDKSDNILVIQDRADEWNFPGGKMEQGENPIECAIREVREEIDLNIHNLTEIFQGDFLFEHVKWRGYFYFADSVSGIPTLKEFNKIKGIKFINNLDEVNFSVGLSGMLEEFSNNDTLQSKTTLWN